MSIMTLVGKGVAEVFTSFGPGDLARDLLTEALEFVPDDEDEEEEEDEE